METYNEYLDETLITGVLQNGLKYYIIPRKDYAEKRAVLTVKYGSVDAVFKSGGKICEPPGGTAHFLEHKLFDNERGSAFDEFSRLGAFVNAFTSFNNTAYYFSCSGGFEKCLERLFGFVLKPFFTEESLEKETGIIEREISMYDDNPAWAAYFGMLDCLYESHPAKNGVAGTRESVREITKDTLYCCYRSFYVPENIRFVCAGGFSEAEISEALNIAGRGFEGGGRRAETLMPAEGENVRRSKLVKKMEVSRPIFQIGFKDRRFDNGALRPCAYKIMLDMLIGEGSELRATLMEKQLADESLSFDYVSGEGYGYAVISGESAEPEALAELCGEKAGEILKNGFPKEDFERIKRKHTGRFIRGFNSIEAIAAASAEYAVKDMSLFDCFEGYRKADNEYCLELLKECFREGGTALSVAAP